MAISLTTDGLRLDYRTTVQTSVSGTYSRGTVIATGSSADLTLPGTWVWSYSAAFQQVFIGAKPSRNVMAIRIN